MNNTFCPAASQPAMSVQGEAGLDLAICQQAYEIELALAQMHSDQQHREAGHSYCGWCRRWFDGAGYVRGWFAGGSTGICRDCAEKLIRGRASE